MCAAAARVDTDEARLKAWASKHLRKVEPGTTARSGEPATGAPEIERAAMKFLLGVTNLPALANTGRAKTLLRGFLDYTAGKVKVANSTHNGVYKLQKGGTDMSLKLVSEAAPSAEPSAAA